MLEGRKKKLDRSVKHTTSESATDTTENDESIMTRKPIRIRRQRIPILQSGYCAICNLPYNSIEDHIQSKKHQKLIGEDANYIALNSAINGDVGIESLLSLTGIDAIGFDDFSPKRKRRTMPKKKASSAVTDIVKSSKKLEKDTGHKLRSRKHVNYLSPPLDVLEEDSFEEKPSEPETKPSDNELKAWDSGRPKRNCNRNHKKSSSEEQMVENESFYKVEVKTNEKDKRYSKAKGSKSVDSEKKLIVKFKKLRNSELVQLNNEATNFLFPKKDESSSSEDEQEEEGPEDIKTEPEEGEEDSSLTESHEGTSISEIEDSKPLEKFKVEDEASMDSISSDGKTKKKRRSHAEALILDNQKYYKFETPGSSSYRLRYHGSYLSPVPSAKGNGDLTNTEAKIELKGETTKKEKETKERLKVNLEEYTFSFEMVPEQEKWYQTFQRQDRAEQRYNFCPNYHWNDFVMPHQIPHLRPLDPRVCYNAYKHLHKCICTAMQEPEPTRESQEESEDVLEASPEPVAVLEPPVQHTDEDSKLSEISSGSAATTEEIKEITSVAEKQIKRRRGREISISPSLLCSATKNARKSPRQHASTLAILSSLGQQRIRRSRNANVTVTSDSVTLETIPEEVVPSVVEEKKPATPQKQRKKKIDYFALAEQIEEELNTALNFDTDFTPTTQPDDSFLEKRPNVLDIFKKYDEDKAKEKENSCRRFFNGAPGRKPGKRKKNLTGWPTTKKRKVVKGEISGTIDESDDDGDTSDSIIEDKPKVDIDDRENKCGQDNGNRVEKSSDIRDSLLQPYVYVKKLDNCEPLLVKKIIIKPPVRKAIRRPQRKIPPTTKPPRMLRRHKGRWYRDR
ncbi:unnamed protein product [Ceutorhynchus assimilis]|uniref:DBF4-type domain-containing protein n=1 Tax=Ceutorhynchus assimilis TaxID=467358 RepID=A0A9P0GJD1_9CUCU|nr:unnamed protein product [Ceutorhynchus assimilis]